jgi:PAS domain S-box-containing protein
MQSPAYPTHEEERLADLYDYGILDTPAEKIFDEVAELAAAICGTRIGAITLVDRDRQWFKAQYGIDLGQTTRDASICGHAILESEIFEVPDTHSDIRFADNPVLNGNPAIRFYGGSRLISARGHPIGMLCVMDSQPHRLTEAQRASLQQLADVLMAVLEAGRKSRVLSWFGTLLDNIRDEIFIVDPRSLRYLHANQAAQQHLGYSLREICGMTPMDITGDHDRTRFEGYVQRLRDGEPFIVFEGDRVRANGQQYAVEMRWQLLTTRGRPVILSIVQDVTERRKVERMKNEFVSVVNHELRTPLTSIHGAVKLLAHGAGGELPPAAARLVQLAADNTQRLRAIVDDILDLEKIASGQMEFEVATLDAAQALQRVAAAHEVSAQEAQVTLRVDAAPRLLLRADAQRLHQVLANLVSNALKYAPARSLVTLAVTQAGDWVRLSVRDAGPGIPEHFRSRIFERFAQADMATSRTKGGSGLGLSIAKQMVEQMGGQIGFESRPGRTLFWVDLQRGGDA